MTKEFKKYVLENIPTRLLLGAYKRYRKFNAHEWRDIIEGNIIYHIPVLVRNMYEPVYIVVGKFAHWNPYKGHSCICLYSAQEVKDELDTREHIKRQ